MKIRMEIEDKITENEIVIRCSELTEDVILLQKKLSEILSTKMQLHVMKQKTEYLLNLKKLEQFTRISLEQALLSLQIRRKLPTYLEHI